MGHEPALRVLPYPISVARPKPGETKLCQPVWTNPSQRSAVNRKAKVGVKKHSAIRLDNCSVVFHQKAPSGYLFLSVATWWSRKQSVTMPTKGGQCNFISSDVQSLPLQNFSATFFCVLFTLLLKSRADTSLSRKHDRWWLDKSPMLETNVEAHELDCHVSPATCPPPHVH